MANTLQAHTHTQQTKNKYTRRRANRPHTLKLTQTAALFLFHLNWSPCSILRRVFHVTYTLALLAVSKLDQVQSQVCESEKENKGGHMFTEHNTQTRRHAMFPH